MRNLDIDTKVAIFKDLQVKRFAAKKADRSQHKVYMAEVESCGAKVIAIIHNHTLLGYAIPEEDGVSFVGFDWQSSTSKTSLGIVRNKITGKEGWAHTYFFGECDLEVDKQCERNGVVGELTLQEIWINPAFRKYNVRPMFDAVPDEMLIRK